MLCQDESELVANLDNIGGYHHHMFHSSWDIFGHKMCISFVFQVESELIDKLDILVSENKGDKQYSDLFNTM